MAKYLLICSGLAVVCGILPVITTSRIFVVTNLGFFSRNAG